MLCGIVNSNDSPHQTFQLCSRIYLQIVMHCWISEEPCLLKVLSWAPCERVHWEARSHLCWVHFEIHTFWKMLCACSGEQFKFEEAPPRSPDSLATRDFSASGLSSRTGDWESKFDETQVEDVESTLKEALSLNYEVVGISVLLCEIIFC